MRTGFFGQYFRYKLKSLIGTAVVMAIVNFFSVTLVAMGIYFAFRVSGTDMDTVVSTDILGWGFFFLLEVIGGVALLMLCTGAGMVAMTAVKSFNFYNKPTLTDMIGCLPLTYKQRFLCDFLSGLVVHLASFIPCSAVGLFFAAATQKEYYRQAELSLYHDDIIPLIPTYLSLVLLLLVGYLGIYALACFVTACCGREGSAVNYTLASLFLPTCIAVTYCFCIYIDAVGIDTVQVIEKAVPVLPGLGVWTGAAIRMFIFGKNFENTLKGLCYLTDEPEYIIIAVLLIIALILGAYFLGKHRKTERTGREVVFGGAYYVISSLLVVAFTGIFLTFAYTGSDGVGIFNVLIAALLTFIPYITVELVHRRSLKKIWLAAVRFVVIFTACVGFTLLGRVTGGFGIVKYIPSDSSVKEIKVSGYGLNSNDLGPYVFAFGPYVYASDEAKSVIIGEHRRIIDNLGTSEISTGNEIAITYVLKNGRRVNRSYDYGGEKDIAEKVYENIRKLEPTDSSSLGIVSTRRYDSILISYSEFNRSNSGELEEDEALYLTPGKETELLDILLHDILNYIPEGGYKNNAGRIDILFTLDGNTEYMSYTVSRSYADTLAFLSDPENLRGVPPVGETVKYIFRWDDNSETPTNSIAFLNIEFMSGDENARELISYIREKDELDKDEISEIVSVFTEDTSRLCIAKSDEKAVLREMLKIARVQYESGEQYENQGVIS